MDMESFRQTYFMHILRLCSIAKDSFLRALREVAPELELFLENHENFCEKIVRWKLDISPFYKNKLYLEEYIGQDIPLHLFAETLL